MNRIFESADDGPSYLLKLIGLLFAFILLFNSPAGAESERVSMDSRAFQHGINFVQRADDQWLLVWSSSGNPPAGINRKGNWTHDVYYSLIDTQKLVIRPNRLISKLEAQEPSSSAITEDGNLMITMEDGWNTKQNVAQRYAVYDAAMKPIKAYPQLVQDGGHSGHVAAVNQRFVVFYSDEWIHGGGVDNLGSGDDVLAKVYSSRGEFGMHRSCRSR